MKVNILLLTWSYYPKYSLISVFNIFLVAFYFIVTKLLTKVYQTKLTIEEFFTVKYIQPHQFQPNRFQLLFDVKKQWRMFRPLHKPQGGRVEGHAQVLLSDTIRAFPRGQQHLRRYASCTRFVMGSMAVAARMVV